MKGCVQCRLTRMLFFLVFCAGTVPVCAQTKKPALYFYASSSPSGDPAVIKMAQDLLFSQIGALDMFSVYDKRGDEYSASVLKQYEKDDALVFYVQIYEQNGEWLSKLHLIESVTGKETVLENNYDGYYKILTEAKNSLTALINQFNTGAQTKIRNSAAVSVNTETLAGTWYGEEHIDKIVILRGGRGFVIFKNGASMNIGISINGTILSAVQQSKANASFFPEIPREAALINAPDAEPVRWEMTVENESLMQGVKTSLVAEYDGSGTLFIKRGSIPVRWHR